MALTVAKILTVPWTVPNYVAFLTREVPAVRLAEVDAAVLSEMCDEFRAEVFRKAGKPDPSKP